MQEQDSFQHAHQISQPRKEKNNNTLLNYDKSKCTAFDNFNLMILMSKLSSKIILNLRNIPCKLREAIPSTWR